MTTPNPRQLFDVGVPMRDGVRLSANVFFPEGGRDGGPYPALLERNCYTNQLNEDRYVEFTRAGYAVVLQDVRGRNDSDGDFWPIHQEHDDGYDSVEWVAGQPWCDSNVGTIGASYMGWTQWALLSRRPPHLRASWVSVPAGAFCQQEPFDHGVLMLPIVAWLNFTSGRALQAARNVDWRQVYRHLPVRTMDEQLGRPMPRWREWLAHPVIDDYWRQALVTNYDEIDVPVVVTTGWWDSNVRGGIRLHRELAAAGQKNQHLIVGPWDHGHVGEGTSMGPFDFGESARMDLRSEQIAWFDRWLKGAPLTDQPKPACRLFVTGRNAWREDEQWPPAGDPYALHLHSNGDASAVPGTLRAEVPDSQPPDVYRYDPLDPVIAVPGEWNFYPYAVQTGLDEQFADDLAVDPPSEPMTRPDVLVFLSEPLGEIIDAVGDPEAVLFAATDGPDTDWFVNVDDVDELGRALPVTTGQLGGRFHESLERESLLAPGEVYEFTIPLRPMAHAFLPGHRIRVTITSSRFPVYARNPNTGAAMDSEQDTTRVATNTVYHDAVRPSRVVLPVVRPSGTNDPEVQ